MLGKSFYALLTKEIPTYLDDNNLIPPALFHVIEKACENKKEDRYQSISELRQALHLAYEVILGEDDGVSNVRQLFEKINDRLSKEAKYSSSEIIEFIERLSLIKDNDEQIRICYEFTPEHFEIFNNEKIAKYIQPFLEVYKVFVESEIYGWAFAETIAFCMSLVFQNTRLESKTRSFALDLAIDAATRMNRFAAMDTCITMIKSVSDDELGRNVAVVIQQNPQSFILGIDPSSCEEHSVRQVIKILNKQKFRKN